MKEGISREKLIVQKTANIFTLGQLNSSTKAIWIVFHGYGQSAEHFIERFRDLKDTFIIAPEANNHFYLKGTFGRIGANWMTSYEREDAILDYIEYINLVAQRFELNYLQNCKITIFGFSQGVATLCRWYNQSSININQIILWGALIPNEIEESEKFNNSSIYCVFGKDDEYIVNNKIIFDTKLIEYVKTKRTILTYEEGHSIPSIIFKNFCEKYWE